MNTCEHCGEAFEYTSTGSGRKRKYCTPICRSRANKANEKPSTTPCAAEGCTRTVRAKSLCVSHYNQRYQADRHAKVDMPCAYCGTLVAKVKSHNSKRRPTCSDYCRKALQFPPKSELPKDHWARWYGKTSAWPRFPLKHCDACDTMHAPQHAREKWHSARCMSVILLYRNGSMPESERATVPRQCADCGDTYTSPYVGQERCATCKRKVNRGRWISDRKRLALYERDKYMCHICGDKTNPSGHYLDEDYPTLDHLVPRSKGGSDEDYNLSTCCRGCNTRRGVQELPMLQLA